MNELNHSTTLLLHCEDFTDSSLHELSITNKNASIVENGKFGKGMSLGSNQYITSVYGMRNVNLATEFTIEWWEYSTGASASSGSRAGLFTNRATHTSNGGNALLFGESGTKIFTSDTDGKWNGLNGSDFKDKVNNVWVHWRLVKKGNLWTSYKNGKKFWSETNSIVPGKTDGDSCAIGASITNGVNTGYNAIIDEFRIVNYALCDGDFEVQTKPFNSIKISINSKTYNMINFNVSSLSSETISKVEIIQNDSIKETFVDNYNNLLFDHNGLNFKILVYYNDIYIEERYIDITNNNTKIYLYKEGYEYVPIIEDYKGSSSSKIIKNTNKITLYSASSSTVDNQYISFIFDKLFSSLDFKLYMNYTILTKGETFIGYTSNKNVSTFDSVVSDSAEGDNLNLELMHPNILLNNKYIKVNYRCASTYNSSSVDIHNIYFVKDNVITINNQDNTSLSFSLDNVFDLLTFTQVDILANGKVIKTYTENFDSITYTFDDSLMEYGNNIISIRATYTQGNGLYDVTELISNTLYYKEVVLEELEPIADLLPTATLNDVMQRFSVIESINNSIRNNLKNLLNSKGFEVGDNPRLSTMVKLVNELSNSNSTEITDYINRITALENEKTNTNLLLYNKLISKGVVDINTSMDINELINFIDQFENIIPKKWLYNRGKEYVDLTGGIEKGVVCGNGVAEKYDNYLYSYTLNGSDYSTWVTGNKIDITNISKIYLQFELISIADGDANSPNIWTNISLLDNKTYNPIISAVTVNRVDTNEVRSYLLNLDVSGFTGEYYVAINLYSGGTAKFYEIWMD